ncbi:hypothetical protein [Rheinheimera sp.]|uniref:hypothetical protein n=1 Tax=Rheinheimera sp. TaxID=1869214 RepID=UPI00307EBC4C
MKVFVVLAFSLLLSACVSTYVPPTPSLNLPAKTKIGVLVIAGDSTKHSHVGTTIFNNFDTSYAYNWHMADSIFTTLKSQLEQPGRFEVVDLSRWNQMSLQPLDFVDVQNKNWQFNPAPELLRQRLLAEGIQVVISVYETPSLAFLQCSSYGCSEFYSQGYGLFTRSFLGMDMYFSSAAFAISVETIHQPVDLTLMPKLEALTNYQAKHKELGDFEDPKDFNNITAEEMEPVRQSILTYFSGLGAQIKAYLNGEDLGKTS